MQYQPSDESAEAGGSHAVGYIVTDSIVLSRGQERERRADVSSVTGDPRYASLDAWMMRFHPRENKPRSTSTGDVGPCVAQGSVTPGGAGDVHGPAQDNGENFVRGCRRHERRSTMWRQAVLIDDGTSPKCPSRDPEGRPVPPERVSIVLSEGGGVG